MLSVSHWETSVWMRVSEDKGPAWKLQYFKFLCSYPDIETLSLNQFSPRESYWEFKPHSRAGCAQQSVVNTKQTGYFESFLKKKSHNALYGLKKIYRSFAYTVCYMILFYGFSVLSKCVSLSICMFHVLFLRRLNVRLFCLIWAVFLYYYFFRCSFVF